MALPSVASKKYFFDATGRGQESPKDKQTGGVGVHRYGSQPVCAVSQNPLRSKHFRIFVSLICPIDP